MSVTAKCPACHAAQQAKYDAKLTCAMCGETFTAPPMPVATPVLPKPVQPERNPFDFSPKPPPPPPPREEKPPPAPRSFTPDQPPKRKRTDPTEKPRPQPPAPKRSMLTCGVIGTTILAVFLVACGIGVYQGISRLGKRPTAPEVEPVEALPPFIEPNNPYRVDTQTQLREQRSFSAPQLPELRHGDSFQLLHAPRHGLLFFRVPNGVWTYDLSTDPPNGTHRPIGLTGEMDLAPDQSTLFIGMPGVKRVHRFDLVTREWDESVAPIEPYRLRAVDANRLIILDYRSNGPRLCRWAPHQMKVLTAINSGVGGDLTYNPRNGLVVLGAPHANPHISVMVTNGRDLPPFDEMTSWNLKDGPCGSLHFSPDGARLYYGKVQLDGGAVKHVLHKFPEVIVASSRDLAFGRKGIYHARSGELVSEFAFRTVTTDESPHLIDSHRPAIGVSPDGLSVWVLDRDEKLIRQYALEGEVIGR